MQQQFAESWRALNFLAEALLQDFGDGPLHEGGTFEVTLHTRGRVVRKYCRVRDVSAVAGALCNNFPRATVFYHPDSAYGFIAQIQCHCGHSGSAGCCRSTGDGPSAVTVVLLQERRFPSPQLHNSTSAFK